jgi:hypothetical protein
MKKVTGKGIILLGVLLLVMTAVSVASAGERTLVLPADVITIEAEAFWHTDAETIICVCLIPSLETKSLIFLRKQLKEI